MIGRTVSHYRIDAQLGAGGMGVVYRGEDVRLNRPVALKFLSEQLVHDEDAIRRLHAEARAASALNHPNICTIYDIGDVDGQPFIVMELLKGRSLRDLIAAGPLKVSQLVDMAIAVADALQAAHSQGIVHRDITPGNIFLTDHGHVKILDFGLAKLTEEKDAVTTLESARRTAAGLTLGTLAYMSPEQATGEELDGRTDLFSLGVVLYEAATGRHPFASKTSPATLAAMLNRAPVAPVALNPELPLRLQDVINNCLEKDRELRYQSAGDLRADLKRVRRDLVSGPFPIVEPPPSARHVSTVVPASGSANTPPHAAPAAARRSIVLPVVAATAVIAVAALGAYAWRRAAPDVKPVTATTSTATQLPATTAPPPAIDQREPRTTTPAVESRAPTLESAVPSGERTRPQPTKPAPPPPPPPPTTPAPPPVARSEPTVAAAPPSAPTTAPATPAASTRVTPPPVDALQPQVAPPPPTPAAAERKDAEAKAPARPATEDDDAAIRRVTETYARAIETKDLALFKSIKPNLSRDEERRLQDGFRAVTSQRVALTIRSIDRRADNALVRVTRRDAIEAGGRTQTVDSEQTLHLARSAAGWVLVGIQ